MPTLASAPGNGGGVLVRRPSHKVVLGCCPWTGWEVGLACTMLRKLFRPLKMKGVCAQFFAACKVVVGSQVVGFPSAKSDLAELGSTTVTLDQCLKQFASPEVLSRDNMWYCNKCKEHVQATKTLQVWKLPKVLVIHLKRFEYR